MPWSALLALALLDSVNPSALVVTLALLGRTGRSTVVLPYVMGIYVSYFLLGALLVGGVDVAATALGPWLEHPLAYAVEILIGAVLFALSFRNPDPEGVERRDPVRGTSAVALFLLGLTITALELPTAMPYLAATGLLGASDLGPLASGLRLAVYCAIFVLPPLALAGIHTVLGRRVGPRFERWREKLERGARETTLWIFGLVGFGLMADGLVHVAVLLQR